MAYTNQNLPTAAELPQAGRTRRSEDRQALLPSAPPVVPAPRAQASNRSDPSTNTNSAMLSTRSSNSGGSNRSSVGGWGSGLSLGSIASAYGDHTGTKGYGTGNEYEHSDRVNSIPNAYGGSTGTKGFGTGNDYERTSPRSSPAASTHSSRSNHSGNHLHVDTKAKTKGPKFGNKLLGTAEVVAGKVTNNKDLVERGQERKTVPVPA
ncbi:hypothetical protein Moror_10827 [Moniliophthora roreri MCA 2997]|uniref:Uncharacterized protein n=1 Tax=Moniliophthora roreri (strain MCA 2997) TaxID=1381753 RepID=V2X2H4_MONRO|nr:hypothetical protein Moror_10827 [Moniliophthora roreri MCA 2997]KAI3621153.1 hypothetical protein WG66_014352 [Moniliophthora roreri]